MPAHQGDVQETCTYISYSLVFLSCSGGNIGGGGGWFIHWENSVVFSGNTVGQKETTEQRRFCLAHSIWYV